MRCPGSDTRNWKPGDIFEVPCPVCDQPVEFFRDDVRRRCPACNYQFRNPRLNLSCAQWCPQAKQCLNASRIEQGGGHEQNLLVNRLIEAMKKYNGSDLRRIAHALKVFEYASEILQTEGGDPQVVFAAAILHDIGIHESERKYKSTAGKYQEIEGPPIARKILEEVGLPAGVIDHICKIIANHHSAKDIETLEFRIIWDADWLVNIPDEHPGLGPDELQKLIEIIFKTSTGEAKAKEIYLPGGK
jgi:hypothetical protein